MPSAMTCHASRKGCPAGPMSHPLPTLAITSSVQPSGPVLGGATHLHTHTWCSAFFSLLDREPLRQDHALCLIHDTCLTNV